MLTFLFVRSSFSTNPLDRYFAPLKSLTTPIQHRCYTTPNKTEVWGFGDNTDGQLGLGTEKKYLKYPVPIGPLSDLGIIDIACGMIHSVAIDKTNEVWTFGGASHFQTGHMQMVHVPTKLDQFDKFYKAKAGKAHTLLLSTNGTLSAMGSGQQGQLGFEGPEYQFIPRKIEGINERGRIVDMACGLQHSLALSVERMGKCTAGEITPMVN